MRQLGMPSQNGGVNRRRFLRLVAAGASAAALVTTMSPRLAGGINGDVQANEVLPLKITKKSLAECMAMDPVAMAKQSELVMASYQYLLQVPETIGDSKIRTAAQEILNNPAPTLLQQYPSNTEKEALKQKLVAANYLKPEAEYTQFLPPGVAPNQATQPFFSAPGSGYGSHHSYPGGLVTHVAVNVKATIGFLDAYRDYYGYEMNRDVAVASQLLHDLHKPWVFQWQADRSSLPESPIAGTGAHHVLTTAESIFRGFAPELVVAIACAHNHPGTADDEAQVVGWLKAASIIAGKDPISYGLLESDGKTLPLPRRQEGFMVHLGDHDWVLTVPAAQWLIAKMGDIAKSQYGMSDTDLKTAKFNAFRNYIFSQVTIKRLHQTWVEEKEAGLVALVTSIISASSTGRRNWSKEPV